LRLQQLQPQPEDRKQHQQQQEQQHWHQGDLSSNDHSNNSSSSSDKESQFCLTKATYNSGSRASGSRPTFHHDVLQFSTLQQRHCRVPLENSSTIGRVNEQRELVQHLRHDPLYSSSIVSVLQDPPSFPRENQDPPSASFSAPSSSASSSSSLHGRRRARRPFILTGGDCRRQSSL
jgi:hypothetical protein